MPFATIVVPAFNVAATLADTLDALLAQTFTDFEIVIVNDGSTDGTADIARRYTSDRRVRLIDQLNRGLAGARNSGIAAARGSIVGFCDSDDIWEPEKLQAHVEHFARNRMVGVSYAGSSLIDDDGNFLRTAQKPRLYGVDASHILKRNPIGNGSAPVIRKAVLDQIAYRPAHETERDWYFDETLRQSEDIECWLRIALTTDWEFEGVPGLLTRYRIASGALSANTARQFETWTRMIEKLTPLAPDFFEAHLPAARSYQLRYLARRAIRDMDAKRANGLILAALRESRRPLFEEPIKSMTTIVAAFLLALGGRMAMDLVLKAREVKHG